MGFQNKYKNRKFETDGILFDSKREAFRWQELKTMQAAGIIQGLKRQVKFELLPYQKQFKERGVQYVADFVYYENGVKIVEDVKGFRTKEYIIKRKLFRWLYCQDGKTEFREVR